MRGGLQIAPGIFRGDSHLAVFRGRGRVPNCEQLVDGGTVHALETLAFGTESINLSAIHKWMISRIYRRCHQVQTWPTIHSTCRFARLTNEFSNKIENHTASLASNYMHYKFVCIHQTLRVSPAMSADASDRRWEVEDMVGRLG